MSSTGWVVDTHLCKLIGDALDADDATLQEETATLVKAQTLIVTPTLSIGYYITISKHHYIYHNV